jgi:hypothetical protein
VPDQREPIGLAPETGHFEVFVEDLLQLVVDGKLLLFAAFLLEPEEGFSMFIRLQYRGFWLRQVAAP